MDFFQTIIFAIIQGITELFPVSSVAHGVLTPYVFHWNLDPEFLKEHFLPYVVMLHLRTATIPAALIGISLEKILRHIFSSPSSAAIFLIVNGFLLFIGEKVSGRGKKEIEDLNMGQALVVGLFQSLALIPGFSRSGSSMIAGFWMGLKHEVAARFSMLLATPVIIGASIVEVPKLRHGMNGLFGMSLLGGVLSGIVALIAVWILMKWFKKHEFKAMAPFSIYFWLAGTAVLISIYLV